MTAPNHIAASYIASIDETLQAIVEKLHTIACSQMPGVVVTTHHNALGYGTTASAATRICYIAPQKDYVNLGFVFAADIDDPHQMLQGTGKRMRHIKIKTLKDAGNPAIKPLLKAAWEKAYDDLAQLSTGRKTASKSK